MEFLIGCENCGDTGFKMVDDEATPCECHVLFLLNKKNRIPAKFLETIRQPEATILDNAEFSNIFDRVNAQVASFDRADPRGIVFWGGVGRGKTHLLCHCAYTLCRKGFTGVFWNAQELVDRVKNTFDHHAAERKSDIIEEVASVDILAIDDFGTQRDTEFVEALYTDIFDRRYSAGLSVFLTTNLTPTEFKEQVPGRICSRIIEMTEGIELNSDKIGDYRNTIRTQREHRVRADTGTGV